MPTSLEITLLPGGSIAVAGEIDIGNADTFAAAVVEAWDGRRNLVLDVTALTFIDSTGVGALVQIAREFHCEVVLRGARRNVMRLLLLLGFAGPNGLLRLETSARLS
jgi:anti-anti-sigma factor